MASLDDSNDRLKTPFDFKTPLYFHVAQERKRASRLIGFRIAYAHCLLPAPLRIVRGQMLPNEIDSRSTHDCFAASRHCSSEYMILGP